MYQFAGSRKEFKNLLKLISPFFLQFAFSGIALGILIEKHISIKFIKINSTSILGYFFISLSFINFLPSFNTRFWMILILWILIFITGFFAGLRYSALFKAGRGKFSTNLFSLMCGYAIGLILFTLFFTFLPHVLIYLITFFSIQILVLFTKESRIIPTLNLLLLFCAAFFLKEYPQWGQKTLPIPAIRDCSKCQIEKIRDRNGVTDIVYDPDFGFTMYSNFQSPTVVARKGDMERIEPHVTIPYLLKRYKNVLIIGVGGGQDVVAALHFGAEKIVAVDIDQLRIELMKEKFREYSRELFHDPRVTTIATSGREFFRTNFEKFDLIVVQRPWTTLTNSSFFYDFAKDLFTDEAISIYLKHLSEDGLLFMAIPIDLNDEIPFNLQSRLKSLSSGNGFRFATFNYFDSKIKLRFFASILGPSVNPLEYRKSLLHGQTGGKIENFREDEAISQSETPSGETISDTQIMRSFVRDQQAGFYSVVVGLIIFQFFSMLLGKANEIAYFNLGIGYEITVIAFVFWLPLFFSNFATLTPFVYTAFFALSGIGYLYSDKLNRVLSFSACIFIVISLFSLWHFNLLLNLNPTFLVPLAATFLVLVAFLSAWPFGFLMNKEKRAPKALLIDYIGSTCAVAIFFICPNLKQLFVISALTYLLTSLRFAFSGSRDISPSQQS